MDSSHTESTKKAIPYGLGVKQKPSKFGSSTERVKTSMRMRAVWSGATLSAIKGAFLSFG
ncbi:hypothetical protein DPMN_058950 [Dreissena polymorpha]|uniref:Uncharacterized protein n=1 Tax=Dreissena polymorpha TaxID=45954 RepID=A0A9D4C2P0_DREPO|nr:hypothetical protein DPMN_058950 [Dreissena polymorpha]